MSSLFWLNPSGLWALAGVAAVAVLYLFYRRYKPRPVTGLFLWGVPRRDAAGGRTVREPLLSRAFLFDLLAALFFALAIAGPAWRTEGARPVVLVLDDSFAMRSRNCHVEARARAEKILARADRTAIILAGERPRVLAGLDVAPSEAAKRLASYAPAAFAGDLAAAVALAAQLYGDSLEVHVLTNANPPDLPVGADSAMSVDVLAGAGDNLALGGIWRIPLDGGGEKLIAAIRNYSPLRREAVLTIDSSDRLFSGVVMVEPGGEAFAEARLAGVSDSVLTVRVDAGGSADGIAEDSVAFVPPCPEETVSFGFDAVGADAMRYFRLGLDAVGCIPAAPDSTPDLLVTGNAEPRSSVLTLELAPAGTPGIFLPPLVVDTASLLCRDVDLSATPWNMASRDIVVNPRETYIMAGATPLYWRSSLRRLHLNLVPERSQLVNEPAWPVLLANLAEEARRLKPGLRKALYHPGEIIRYNSDSALRPVLVDGGDGIASRFVGGVMHAPVQAGLYRLLDGETTLGTLSVSPDYGAASNTTILAPTASSTRIEKANAEPDRGAIDLTLPMLALALFCVGMNWRRIAGGTA